ncbi:MAG: hypothetical protein Q9186_004704 [Xanthomendoza sp. 1 TL-2023]
MVFLRPPFPSSPPFLPHLTRRKLEKQDSGNQAVQQCSNHNNQYCCDHNRDPANYCCNQNDDTLFFDLPNGKPTAKIASLGGPADAADDSNSEEDDSTSNPSTSAIQRGSPNVPSVSLPPNPATTIALPSNPAASIVANPPSAASIVAVTPSPSTVTRLSTSSAPNGQTSIILLTSIVSRTPSLSTSLTPSSSSSAGASPADSPPPSSSSSSSSNTAAIGGGVGGGIAALVAAFAIFFLLRRRKRRKAREVEEATMKRPQAYLADQRGMEYMYRGQQQHAAGGGEAGMGTPYTGSTALGGEEGSPEIDGKEIPTPLMGGKGGGGVFRPGEKTRVDEKKGLRDWGGADEKVGGEGLGFVATSRFGGRKQEEVSELPAGDVPRKGGREGEGEGDGAVVDKWRRYEIAAEGRR